MSDETWLIAREMDAQRKCLVATVILVFDFELFIGELGEEMEVTPIMTRAAS